MVKMFNFWYFFFAAVFILFIVGLYYLLKNRNPKTQKTVIATILLLNLALHFFKILFPPFKGTEKGASEVGFTTLCATSICFFPFFFLSKSKHAKDFMFFFGFLSGTSAVLLPTEALTFGYGAMTFFVWRFYLQHIIIGGVPLVMVLLKMHTLDYKRIWKMPFYCILFYCFIMLNQVLQVELGLVSERHLTVLLDKYPDFKTQDFFELKYKNPSLVWGPNNEYGGISKLVTLLTPDFMTKVPFGEYKGQPMYWPLFYLFPTIFVGLWCASLVVSLPWECKHLKADITKVFKFVVLVVKK